jgi:hypothetical protein
MYFGTWIDAKEFFDTAHFLIACRVSFSRWRLLFAIGYGRSGLPLPTITISKMAKCRSSPTQDIPIPQTDSTKPISRLKRDEHDTSPYPQEVNLPRYKMS